MTDQELIKALRDCEKMSCADCPMILEPDSCHNTAVNRLEALLVENERLKQDMQVMKYGFDLLKSRTHTAEPPSTEGVE